jgi:hypothetical protein
MLLINKNYCCFETLFSEEEVPPKIVFMGIEILKLRALDRAEI